MESTYTFLKNSILDFDVRLHTSVYVFLSFLAIGLIIQGVILHYSGLLKARKYPFITISIVAVSSSMYAFVGTGWEVNRIQDLTAFKYSLLSFAFHGSFYHITGNLPYFVLTSLLLEQIADVKANRNKLGWYLLPFIVGWAISLRVTEGINFGFGLSYAVELLAFALWAYLIENWKFLSNQKLMAILVLLAGIPMSVFFAWVYQLTLVVPFGFTTDFDLAKALGHVTVGLIGMIGVGVFLGRNPIRSQLKRISGKV